MGVQGFRLKVKGEDEIATLRFAALAMTARSQYSYIALLRNNAICTFRLDVLLLDCSTALLSRRVSGVERFGEP
jgi:hypothetical protein